VSTDEGTIVLNKRQLSVILLLFGAIICTYMVLLSTPISAQGGGDCPGAEEVNTTTGNGNKQSPVFNITGTSFRLTVESTATSEDPQFAGVTIFVYPEGETVSYVTSFSVEEGRDDSSIVNAGPGEFYLNIFAANADYTITVEDCTGTNGEDTNQDQIITTREPEETRRIINIPKKPLPPTGGWPVYGMVAGFVIAGAGLLGVGIAINRNGPRR
jgi:hypothetical protein